MIQRISIICLYGLISSATCASSLSAIVPLSGGGTVAPSTSLSISLNGVVPTATYSVVCYIDTVFAFQYVLLGSSFSETTSVITSYSLNGRVVTQDQLIAGHNIAVIEGKFTNPATGYVVFTNLDTINPFDVTNCFAIPLSI